MNFEVQISFDVSDKTHIDTIKMMSALLKWKYVSVGDSMPYLSKGEVDYESARKQLDEIESIAELNKLVVSRKRIIFIMYDSKIKEIR